MPLGTLIIALVRFVSKVRRCSYYAQVKLKSLLCCTSYISPKALINSLPPNLSRHIQIERKGKGVVRGKVYLVNAFTGFLDYINMSTIE